jgi:hypothetical protein
VTAFAGTDAKRTSPKAAVFNSNGEFRFTKSPYSGERVSSLNMYL